jgi:hypothetical protein
VAASTDSGAVKWSNVELGSPASDYPAQAQNGFSFTANPGFATDPNSPTPSWINAGAATNNAVQMKFLFVPSLSVTNSPQIYTSSAFAAAVNCSSGGAVSNVQYNGSGTVPSAAGTYAVTANCAANGSYSALTVASAGNFVISPATPTLSVTNSPQTYTGSAISAAVSCLGGGAASNVLYNGSSSIPSATGTYAITADCAASTNYSAVTGASAGNFVITQTQESGTTPGGTVNAGIVGGSFVSGTAQFGTPTNPPSGESFPYGVFGFTASTTVGGSITVTLTYPQALAAGTKVWKDLNGAWLDWTNNVMIIGNTITYTITDGGAGDADGSVNGSITDPLGPASPASSIPSLSEWAQLMLVLMVLSVIGWHFHRERSY